MAPFDLASLLYGAIRRGEEEGARAHEVVVGVVVDINDLSKLARVKIKVPMLGTDPRLSTGATRPLTPRWRSPPGKPIALKKPRWLSGGPVYRVAPMPFDEFDPARDCRLIAIAELDDVCGVWLKSAATVARLGHMGCRAE